MSEDVFPPAARVRTNLVAFALVAVWAVIMLRLIAVQGFSRLVAERAAKRQRTFVEVLPGRPGDLRDREGRLLATSLPVQSLAIDPSAVDEPWPVAQRLADAVGVDAERLVERIIAAEGKRFLWVKRRLREEETAAVLAAGLSPEIWHFRTEFERVSPLGPVAAHVLGRRDIDNQGRGGVEQGLESLLRGRDGHRTLIRDARGYVIDVDSDRTVEPVHGRNLQLTIDAVLQQAVEARLDRLVVESHPLAACAIVLDPRTGEVLAMASRPELPTARPTQDAGDALTANEPPPPEAGSDPAESLGWRNHAIASMFEPGSTFKPFIVGAAIDRGLIRADESFDCEFGAYRMGRRVLHDHHSYGRLSVTDILVKSSNIGMAKIGERLTNAGLFDAATAFGFGHRTGIELPGELPGQLHPLDAWTSYSTGSIPMGQELAATPLQVAAAHAALANGGRYLSPHLLLRIDDPAMSPPSVITRRVLSPESSRWLIEGPMVEVVTRGTGQKARLKGYTVFGKTGTAQKLDPETGGYSHTRHIGSFVCGAPAHEPRAIVLVAVDEPTTGTSHFGGIVAAPAAAEILGTTLEHLRVPPEAIEESPVPPRTAANQP